MTDTYIVKGGNLLSKDKTFEVKGNAGKNTTELGILDYVFDNVNVPKDTDFVFITRNDENDNRLVYTEWNADHNEWHFNFMNDF